MSQLSDVCLGEGGKLLKLAKRWYSLFHDSRNREGHDLISNEGLLKCWRHNCSFNGLQALVVLSGYKSCSEAGSHYKGMRRRSEMIGDNGAIFHAWRYAKQRRLYSKRGPNSGSSDAIT